jgi:hypothetical protein
LHVHVEVWAHEPMLSREAEILARRLLDFETVTAENSEPEMNAVLRLSEKLRQPLCTLVGVDNYGLLVARALKLARAEAPSLSRVQVAADGSLQRLHEVEPQADTERTGTSLIAHLLELFVAFLGVPVMLRLLKEVSPHLDVTATSGTPAPFENILQEVDQLTNVSKRLESLAKQHPSVEEALLSISGNVRSTATVLGVLAIVKNKKNELPEDVPQPPSEHYLM